MEYAVGPARKRSRKVVLLTRSERRLRGILGGLLTAVATTTRHQPLYASEAGLVNSVVVAGRVLEVSLNRASLISLESFFVTADQRFGERAHH